MDKLTEKVSTPIKPDILLITDNLSPQETDIIIQANVADARRVRVIIDHDTPSGTVAVAEKQKKLQNFAKNWNISYTYGQGISYQLLGEQEDIKDCIIAGCGNHVSTVGAYGALGITVSAKEMASLLNGGTLNNLHPTCHRLSITGNFTAFTSIKDLALELIKSRKYEGTIMTIFAPKLTNSEKITLCNLLANGSVTACITQEEPVDSDTVSLDTLKPLAVEPGDFSHIVPAKNMDGLRVNQVFIGGCCGGTLEVLHKAAQLLDHRQVSRYVRVMIAPASHEIYLKAIDEGLIDIFMDAHVLVMNSGCSACWAQSQGRCDQNEVFVTTGSINKAHWAGAHHNGIYITSVTNAVYAALTGFLNEY